MMRRHFVPVSLLCAAGCFASPKGVEPTGSSSSGPVVEDSTTIDDDDDDDDDGDDDDSTSTGDGGTTSSGGTSGSSTAASSIGDDSTSDIEPPRGCAPTPETVCIPGGEFTRGTPEGAGGGPDESPQTTITLGPFEVDRFEVTVARYEECVTSGACTVREATIGPPDDCTLMAAHPANCVTWAQASTFCESEGRRLPTEAEWERVARGTTGELYPWGDADPTCDLAVYSMKGPSCTGSPTSPVGTTSPAGDSPDGVSDMAGNVFEWTSDWYSAQAYAQGPTTDPVGPQNGQQRVIRGGAHTSIPDELRGAHRLSLEPITASSAVGFRCVRRTPG